MEENTNQPTADLELGTEVNTPMPDNNSEVTPDSSANDKLADFFMRALSDGQMKTESGDSENKESEAEAQEPEAEQAEEPQAEATTEAETDEVRYDEDGTPKGVQKRLNKLTALRREAEERSKKLEEELESLKRQQAAPVKPATNNPYAEFDSEEKIKAEYERQRKIRLFCERYPDGYYDSEDDGKSVSRDEVAKAKVTALRAIEEFLPQQAQYIQTSKEFKSLARKEFPWLDDPTDTRASTAKKFIEAVPEIKKFPDYELYAAQLALGMVSYNAQKKNARNFVQSPTVQVQPTQTSSAPRPAMRVDEVKAKESMDRFRRSGSVDDLAEVFKSKFI
jgi:hypothetical protein